MLGRQWAEYLEKEGVAVALVHRKYPFSRLQHVVPAYWLSQTAGFVDTAMNKGKTLIPVKESAEGILKVLAGVDIAKGAEGILVYDGTVLPW